MAKDLNKVQLTGYLGADPESRFTQQGSAVTTFRVASGRTWTSADGTRHDETEWFRIVAWDKLGEICRDYLTKGTRVYIEGRLQTRKWTDKDGQDRYTTEVIAQDMIILSSRSERNQAPVDSAEEELPEVPPPTQARAVREPQPAPAAPRSAARSGTAAAPRGNGNGRSGSRNVPQPIEGDDDIPF